MPPSIIVLMGPAGAGKTTVGIALARELGWPFMDADAFHSPENLSRLSQGIALSDDDRAPWLALLARAIETALVRGTPAVLACSALRRAYREALVPRGTADGAVQFIYLRVRSTTLATRLSARRGHVVGPALLGSQLAALEEPSVAEGVLTLDGEQPVAALIREIRDECGV